MRFERRIRGVWRRSARDLAALSKTFQTVRKLAICTKTVDQIADFHVRLNTERSEASKLVGKVRESVASSEFSNGLLRI
jgi:hypothetical protein